MKSLEEIKTIIKEHKPELKSKYKVKEIGVFGSYVRGEQSEKSDIDILVDFSDTISLWDECGLVNYLEKLLQTKIDIVDKPLIRQELKSYILGEVVYI